MTEYLLGLDIGSSSIKASVIDVQSGCEVGAATSPEEELPITAIQSGWAEQEPELWWQHVKKALSILQTMCAVNLKEIRAIGISYQMHGLVLIDKDLKPLRPSIIWCDSRAVEIGERAFREMGDKFCLSHFLNSPGNFTASKLRWIKENEPELFQKIYKILLPGDYIALKLTGIASTTPSGLSEGILWDFKSNEVAKDLLNFYEIPEELLPSVNPTFSNQGEVTPSVAGELGLTAGIPVCYRAGDQPNNAFSLNVLNPGEAATTAGTSGVIYGVTDKAEYDPLSRVNTFLHVNNENNRRRLGILLCVNGTAILNSWLRKTFLTDLTYEEMNSVAARAPIGSDGLRFFPYGNGAERTLQNRNVKAQLLGLEFSRHDRSHIIRAAHEGIIYALNYGLEVMREMGCGVKHVRAGHANMFLSPLFAQIFSDVCQTTVTLYKTDGAQGAARGAGIGAEIFSSQSEAFSGLKALKNYEPSAQTSAQYQDLFGSWKVQLQEKLLS